MDDATPKLVERVRAYLGARESVVPEIGGERFDIIHDIDHGSRGHFRLRASDVRSLADALEAAQRPPVSPVLDAINDAREAVARGERPSIIIDTDDYPAPERPPEGEAFAEAFERFSMGLDYSNRDEAEAGFRAGWEAAQRPPVSPEVDRLRARVRELEAQRADVLAEVQALEHSDWLRDTIAGDRLRAALTDGTPSNTERNES